MTIGIQIWDRDRDLRNYVSGLRKEGFHCEFIPWTKDSDAQLLGLYNESHYSMSFAFFCALVMKPSKYKTKRRMDQFLFKQPRAPLSYLSSSYDSIYLFILPLI